MAELATKIANAYPNFNKTAKLIADAYLKDPAVFLNKNLKELGAITKTSGASVLRFCKQLGFQGFKDFQINCAKEAPAQPTNAVDAIITENDNPASVLYKLQVSSKKDIDDLGRSIDKHQLNKAVRLLRTAEQIYIAGEGASGLAASDLFYKLIRSGKRANYVESSHIALEQASNITANDVLVIFSYSGLTQEPMIIARQARKKRAKIIAVTRGESSPLTKSSDVIISLPANEKLLRFGATNSLFSEIFVSSLLYLSMISPDLNMLNKRMKATQELTNQLKLDK